MKAVKLSKEHRASIGFDELSWKFIHTMGEDLGISICAAIRMLIRQEAARKEQQQQ